MALSPFRNSGRAADGFTDEVVERISGGRHQRQPRGPSRKKRSTPRSFAKRRSNPQTRMARSSTSVGSLAWPPLLQLEHGARVAVRDAERRGAAQGVLQLGRASGHVGLSTRMASDVVCESWAGRRVRCRYRSVAVGGWTCSNCAAVGPSRHQSVRTGGIQNGEITGRTTLIIMAKNPRRQRRASRKMRSPRSNSRYPCDEVVPLVDRVPQMGPRTNRDRRETRTGTSQSCG